MNVQQINDDVRIFEDQIKYFSGIDESKITFDHQLNSSNDGLDVAYASMLSDDAYSDYAKENDAMEDYKQQVREEDID